MEAGIRERVAGGLRELKARFTNEITVKNGQFFRLGWEQVGDITAIIGPRRPKEKGGEPHLHVNLDDLPTSNKVKLRIQVAENGWINIHNLGVIPTEIFLSYPDEQHLYGTAPKSPQINRETGRFLIEQNEALTVNQGGSLFNLTWKDVDGKSAQLEIESRKNYSNEQGSIQVKYQILPTSSL